MFEKHVFCNYNKMGIKCLQGGKEMLTVKKNMAYLYYPEGYKNSPKDFFDDPQMPSSYELNVTHWETKFGKVLNAIYTTNEKAKIEGPYYTFGYRAQKKDVKLSPYETAITEMPGDVVIVRYVAGFGCTDPCMKIEWDSKGNVLYTSAMKDKDHPKGLALNVNTENGQLEATFWKNGKEKLTNDELRKQYNSWKKVRRSSLPDISFIQWLGRRYELPIICPPPKQFMRGPDGYIHVFRKETQDETPWGTLKKLLGMNSVFRGRAINLDR